MRKEHVQYIVIHHYGYTRATLQSIRKRDIEERGWEHEAHHFYIGNGNGIPDGEVVEGRPLTKGSCQCRGFNSRSISICIIGDFDRYFPSKKQWDSLIRLCKDLMDEFTSVPVDCVIGHRESFELRGKEPEKSCPGWKTDMDRIRKDLYEGGAELFTDGNRRRFDMSICMDGTILPNVLPVVRENKVLIDVKDLESIFDDIVVEMNPRMKRVEIKNEKLRGESNGI